MDVTVRRLERRDLQNGFLESLDSLRETSNMDPRKAEELFDQISADGNCIIAVAEMDGRIVGACTLLVELKFLHHGGRVGHIEDFVVLEGMQGRGIGTRLARYVLGVAAERGCYKTVLDCNDRVARLHERNGFKKVLHCMRFDHAG